MKKICKSMAIFAIMVGLVCIASCVSIEPIVDPMFDDDDIGDAKQVAFLNGRQGSPYAFFRLYSNGKAESAAYDNSDVSIKASWESDIDTDYVENGDTITVTIEDKTGKGTVRHISSKYIPLNPNDNSDKPDGDYILITYSVNLGALGVYTYEVKGYGR